MLATLALLAAQAIVILRGDATRYVAAGADYQTAKVVRLKTPSGALVSARQSDIDQEATRLANLPPTPTPTSTPAPMLAGGPGRKASGGQKARITITSVARSPTPTPEGYVAAASGSTGATSSPTPGSYSSSGSSGGGPVSVKGYTKKDGTYVPPHTRSAPRGKR